MKKLFMLLGLMMSILIVSACTIGSNDDGADAEADSSEGESSTDTSETAESDENTGSGEYSIGVSYTTPESGSTHMGMENFKELAEEKTNGEVVIELYPNGQLYASEREAIEAVQSGSIEMTVAASAPVVGFDNNFLALDLPFIFPDHETAYEALDGELGQTLLDGLPEVGLVGLAYGETGMRQMTNNSHPIESPEDLNGMQIRTMENDVHINTFDEYGASPSPFAFGELYSALQQNIYDGMENPINLVDQMNFYEVQDYLTISNHAYTATVAFINNDYFENLPEDIQTSLEEAAVESMDYQREVARQQDEEGLEVIEEHMEINELTEEQRQEFIDAAEPIFERYEEEIGTELMELTRSYSE